MVTRLANNKPMYRDMHTTASHPTSHVHIHLGCMYMGNIVYLWINVLTTKARFVRSKFIDKCIM